MTYTVSGGALNSTQSNPHSCVDPEVQGLKVIIDCPQSGSSRATYKPPPITRWSKCGGNDTVMVLLGSGTSKVSKETQPE